MEIQLVDSSHQNERCISGLKAESGVAKSPKMFIFEKYFKVLINLFLDLDNLDKTLSFLSDQFSNLNLGSEISCSFQAY